MPSSDSEDFESADEGQDERDKKVRKKRTSSSNYSDNALETDSEPKGTTKNNQPPNKSQVVKPNSEAKSDGWDDFDIDCPIENTKLEKKEVKESSASKAKEDVKSQDTGWDDFDDWGNEETTVKPTEQKQQNIKSDADIKELTEKLAASTTKNNSWGWGWGVDSLLSSATAGITSLTSQVSQGISNVLETGIGAPDPEELARKNLRASTEMTENKLTPENKSDKCEVKETEQTNSDDVSFPFGSLLSDVTKFVGSTGTKVIAGGLDTLETIGKKTMEVLQDGDPGLAKKRAMLGLDPGEKPVLSQILREAKAKADEEDKIREEKREAKEVHYENLFDDFEGLVHLEALEMLSKQVSMRIEERLRAADAEKKQDIKETLQQVIELCEIPEDEEDEENSEDQSKPDAFHEKLQTATQDLGLKLQFQPLVKQYTDILDFLSSNNSVNEKAIYKRAVSSLAQATALSVEIYHKTAEMLLVKTRRSTADEADALTQMTVVLTKHVSELATLFTVKLNSIESGNKDQINNYITNIFLESGNSSTYIQNAFQLALPILQIGAV